MKRVSVFGLLTKLLIACVLVGVTATNIQAGVITSFTMRSTFDAAVGGPQTIEDFTSRSHYPITTGVLNSSTSLVVAVGPPILPGDIQPGVTYSTPTAGRSGNFFNIDGGGGFSGGFLDGVANGPNATLTTAFDGPITAFGFDTNSLMGSTFDLSIQFISGSDFTDTISAPGSGLSFFGFQSDQQDIVSAQITGSHRAFDYALDNFTFTEHRTGVVPEPTSLAVFGLGALGLVAGGIRRRKQKQTT